MMSRNCLYLNDLTSPHDTHYFERGREKGGLRGTSVVTYFFFFFSNVAIQAYYDEHEPLKGHGEYRLINSSNKLTFEHNASSNKYLFNYVFKNFSTSYCYLSSAYMSTILVTFKNELR